MRPYESAPHLVPARDAMLELADDMVSVLGKARTRWFVEQLLAALQEPRQ